MFSNMTPESIKIAMSLVLFGSGMFNIAFGVWRLLGREFQTTMRSLAVQSTRIGQKAITDNIAGVADSAARLMESVNQLVRTNAGIGAFLTMLGMVQVVAGYWIVTHQPLRIAEPPVPAASALFRICFAGKPHGR